MGIQGTCKHCQRQKTIGSRGLCWRCYRDPKVRAMHKSYATYVRGRRPLCRHCQAKPANRSRGLCWSCYYTPGVRDLYLSTSKYVRKGVGIGGAASSPANSPTNAPPGSAEKVAVLEERAANRQDLWHPNDRAI